LTGSRFFVVSTFLAFLTATLLGVWTIQNLLFRQYVSQVTEDLRVINSATRDATDSMSTDERILSLRTQLARLNAQLDRQTRTRAGLVDQARAATDAAAVGEILEELGAVIRQSQETQAAAQDALLDLTDQYAIKIHALEQRTGGGGFDFWAGLVAVVGLLGAVSTMALGWRKDAREAADARRRERPGAP
jgi:hypothetical protein